MRSAISPRLAISSFWIAMLAYSTTNKRLVEFDRLAVGRPGSGGPCRPWSTRIGFITFIASMISKVSPSLTLLADA